MTNRSIRRCRTQPPNNMPQATTRWPQAPKKSHPIRPGYSRLALFSGWAMDNMVGKSA